MPPGLAVFQPWTVFKEDYLPWYTAASSWLSSYTCDVAALTGGGH
jgi:hypothetical protein